MEKEENKATAKTPSNDAEEGRTVFIRNLNFDTTEESLKEYFEEFGEVKYAKIVKDRVTERSRGTAFVKFAEKEDADDILLRSDSDPEQFQLDGRQLLLCMALVRSEVPKSSHTEGPIKKKQRPRNLYLASVGVITKGSKEAESLSKDDLRKRAQVEKTRIEKLKDPNTFISPVRLCVRNIPATVEDRQLKKIFIKAGGVDCRVTECRIMRDLDRVNAKGVAKSRGYAFIAYDEHEHAMKALKAVNNNPSFFGEDKRPIVEFSIENRKALETKARRLEQSRKRTTEVAGDVEASEEAPAKKKRKLLQVVQPDVKLPASLPSLPKGKKKLRKRNLKAAKSAGSKKPKWKLSRKEARIKKKKKV